mgnify:CR=1 FL=1
MNTVPPSPVRVALVEDHDGTRRELVASFEDHPESVRMVGAFRDPVFGPVVMAGLGGIFAEIIRDVAVRPAPIEPPSS